jgi:CheY-like chemotaxis protein/HPt (histidine-containing phosphotransfer) domain-containing protein
MDTELDSVPVTSTRLTVLVIEDTPVNQQLAKHQLDRLEMDCVIADSAEDGLELLDKQRFHAILMDHQLPGMNGRDATREIRRRGNMTPIIGITASSTAANEQACLAAGMDAFLPKPVGLERLSAALESVIGTAPSSSPAEPGQTAPTSTDQPAIDSTALEQLADELGDRAIVASLIRTFLGELESRELGISGDDETLAARQAHTLKSSAKLLGAIHLSEVCDAFETDPSERHRITHAAASARAGLTAWLDREGRHHPDGDDGGT